MLLRELNTKKTKEDFKRVVGIYDVWSRLTESKAVGTALGLAEIHDHLSILEVACGTGVVFEEIVSRNRNSHDTGIDLHPICLPKLKRGLGNLTALIISLRRAMLFIFPLPVKPLTF